MKYIKLCKTYKNIENPDIKTLLQKYGFILERSKYSFYVLENAIWFKQAGGIDILTGPGRREGGIILKTGTINIEIKRKRLIVCWKIPLFTIWFRAFLISLVFSLPYYFMSTNKDINDTIILFVSVFLITSIISFIALKVKVSDINGGVL